MLVGFRSEQKNNEQRSNNGDYCSKLYASEDLTNIYHLGVLPLGHFAPG